jgi:Family of unknown function (DUF6188)
MWFSAQFHLYDNGVNQDLSNGMLRHMYGLKKETNLSFLTGRELIQVAIGTFQVQFHFDEAVAVSVEPEFRYFDGQREWIWGQEPSSPQVAGRTVAMLGASITSFESSEDGTLTLTFSNGHRLTMVDSSKEYESYDITRPGNTIIV